MAEMNDKNTAKTEAKKAKTEKKPGIFAQIGKFFRGCVSEMKKVVWLSAKDTKKSAILVVITVVVVSAFIGILDYAFSWVITALGGLI